MGENVFRGGFRVGTTSSYSLPTIKGSSGTTLIADSNGDLYWGTITGGGTSTSSGVTGSATSGQLTFWNGTTSIAGDSNLTYDSINNVLKIEGANGGLFIDISGDATPPTFPINPFTSLYLNSEGKTSIYNPERMIGSAEGAAQDAPNVLITSSNPTFPQNGIVGPNIAFTYSDDANTGNMTGVIGIIGAGGTGSGDEDGTLMVFGTRPNSSGGPFDPKEAIRIGRNQFVGVYYKPGATQSPPAMLTIGTNLANSNNIALRETNTSLSAITDYGQFYINSTDKKPYFLTSGGTAYDLTTGITGPTGPGFQTISNVEDNRILTSDGGTSTANAEANLTFNGTTLILNGNQTISGTIGVTGQATFGNTVNIISSATGNAIANLSIQTDGRIIKANGNAIVENYYYSVSNSLDTTFYEDDKVILKWDETGNDLKFTMKIEPSGSGDMRSLGVLMGSNTTFNVAIVTPNIEYDLYSAGIAAGNRMEAFVTAENDVTHPAYHVTAYNTGESFHNTIWIRKIIRV